VLYWHHKDITCLSGQTGHAQKPKTARKGKNAMVFVPKTDAAQVNLRFTLLDQQIENTLYFLYNTGGLTEAEMITLGDDLLTWWATEIAAPLVDDLELREAYVTDMTTQFSPAVTVTPTSAITGGATSDPLPNNVSLCVSFRTSGRGRSARGRNYVGGWSEGSVAGNLVASGTAETIRSGYEELTKPTTFTDDWTWIVYSRFAQGNPRPQAFTPPVTSVVLTDLTVDSQRRRLPGRGR
jgi:hypothetical protein